MMACIFPDFSKTFSCALVCGFFLMHATFAAAQSEGEQLASEKRCYACHQLNEASLGPTYEAIAARHAPRKDVMIDILARKIVHGGGGNWGVVPMVPNQWVAIDEARLMAEWILGLTETQ